MYYAVVVILSSSAVLELIPFRGRSLCSIINESKLYAYVLATPSCKSSSSAERNGSTLLPGSGRCVLNQENFTFFIIAADGLYL